MVCGHTKMCAIKLKVREMQIKTSGCFMSTRNEAVPAGDENGEEHGDTFGRSRLTNNSTSVCPETRGLERMSFSVF